MNALGREFLHIARRGILRMLTGFIEEGFPVNWQDARNGQSALHVASAAKARKALLVLAESGRCDFLLRDKEGRLASEMAFLFGDDPAAARWLRIHERRQAAAKGITLTRRPKPSPG
jgi:ankyrin repeat protein